jgi:bifunctional DNase/RNase
MDIKELVIDSVRVSGVTYEIAVILKEKNGDRYLPMWVDRDAGNAITAGIQKVNAYSSGPLTHELVNLIISRLGASIKYFVIDEFKNNVFQAKVFLLKEHEDIEMECRPSDALAIAVRTGSPVYVAGAVLEEAGITLDEIDKITTKRKPPESQIHRAKG